jgi:hypothetical protein
MLLLLLLLSAPALVTAKKRGNRKVQSMKTACERGECSSVHEDDFGNCVLKCQSAACYEEVYGKEELEPGEIDHKRTRQFTTCVNAEQRRGKREKKS